MPMFVDLRITYIHKQLFLLYRWGVCYATFACPEAYAAFMVGRWNSWRTIWRRRSCAFEGEHKMSLCSILSIGDFIFFSSGFSHHLGRRNGLEYYSSTLSCPVYPLRSTPHFRRDKYPSIWHSLVSHYCVYRNTEGSYICYVLGTSYWNML